MKWNGAAMVGRGVQVGLPSTAGVFVGLLVNVFIGVGDGVNVRVGGMGTSVGAAEGMGVLVNGAGVGVAAGGGAAQPSSRLNASQEYKSTSFLFIAEVPVFFQWFSFWAGLFERRAAGTEGHLAVKCHSAGKNRFYCLLYGISKQPVPSAPANVL